MDTIQTPCDLTPQQICAAPDLRCSRLPATQTNLDSQGLLCSQQRRPTQVSSRGQLHKLSAALMLQECRNQACNTFNCLSASCSLNTARSRPLWSRDTGQEGGNNGLKSVPPPLHPLPLPSHSRPYLLFEKHNLSVYYQEIQTL